MANILFAFMLYFGKQRVFDDWFADLGYGFVQLNPNLAFHYAYFAKVPQFPLAENTGLRINDLYYYLNLLEKAVSDLNQNI